MRIKLTLELERRDGNDEAPIDAVKQAIIDSIQPLYVVVDTPDAEITYDVRVTSFEHDQPEVG